MTFGERLVNLRKEHGYQTRKELANVLGIPETTLRNYEKDEREPGHIFLKSISELFDVSTDYLLGLTNDREKIDSYQLKKSEYKILETYLKLDDYGKETINIALERETNRVRQLMDKSSEIVSLNAALHKTPQTMRIYTYLRKIACAGTGFYFDDIPTETIAAPYMEGADFIISVNGDSMEPDYHDGEYLYVKKTDHINYGEVGIFTVNNECFLKEFGEEGLISRNKNYKDIPGNEDVRLIGKVIGKVQGDE